MAKSKYQMWLDRIFWVAMAIVIPWGIQADYAGANGTSVAVPDTKLACTVEVVRDSTEGLTVNTETGESNPQIITAKLQYACRQTGGFHDSTVRVDGVVNPAEGSRWIGDSLTFDKEYVLHAGDHFSCSETRKTMHAWFGYGETYSENQWRCTKT